MGYTKNCKYFKISSDRKKIHSPNVDIAPLNGSAAYGGCVQLDTDRIAYVGGASSHQNTMEIYNIKQNKWIKHNARTKFAHTYYPSIWTDPNHGGNILYIAGDYLGGSNNTKDEIGCIECIDFRESKPSWKSIWKLSTMQNTFFRSYGTQVTTGIFSICC